MFKKFSFFFIAALIFAGCNILTPGDDPDKPDNPDDPENPDDPDKPVADSLTLSLTDVNFTSDKDACLLEIKTNKTWTASTGSNWITMSAATGNKNTAIIIGAAKNDGFKRETTVTIKAGDKTSQLKITQASSPVISVKIQNVTFNMILVEGGQFTMGSRDQSSFGMPHQVQLNDFYISESEVTNQLWMAVKGSLPYKDHSEDDKPSYPVSETAWNTVVSDFIPALNQASGKTFRLPTEAEWEYAALGGKKSQTQKYSGSDVLDDVAWYLANSSVTKHNVKEKLPNQLGLYDMSGNVNEWCSDWYDDYYGFQIVNNTLIIPDLQTNPKGPDNGTKKLVRGGNIESDEFWGFSYCNVRYRSGVKPTGYDTYPGNPQEFYMIKNTGFRLVISL